MTGEAQVTGQLGLVLPAVSPGTSQCELLFLGTIFGGRNTVGRAPQTPQLKRRFGGPERDARYTMPV